MCVFDRLQLAMNSLKDELANAKPFLHAYEVSPFFNNAFRSLASHIMVKTNFLQNTALATSSKKFTIFDVPYILK